MKRPRGNRRAKVVVESDMIALVERMQLRNEDAKDAGKALGIPATTAQRYARKGLLRVLAAAAQEKIKAIATADANPNPTMQGQFELPEPVQPEPAPQVIVLPAVPRSSVPVEPEPEPEPVWEWEHLMSREEFLTRTQHRQKQLLEQWEQNTHLDGVRWTPVLRGKPSNQGVCFNPNHSQFNCDCHSEGPFTV